MRVLGVYHAYPPSHGAGAEWMAHSLHRALVAAGHDVRVVLSRDDQVTEPYTLDGVEVVPFRSKHTLHENVPWADVLLTHLENTPRASIVARLAGKPCVHVLHNTFGPTRGWIRTGRPALLVYNSAWMRDDYRQWMIEEGVAQPPGIVVHPPVYGDDYRTTPGGSVTLINMTKEKGADTFYRLAAAFPRVPFLAVEGGYGVQVVRDLPNVTHQPNTARMADDVYSRTRVLLMPSQYESWGRVGVEAMTSGIPVIAHPTPGLLESLGEAGRYADRTDHRAWVMHLAGLLDPARWQVASRLAAQRARQLDPAADLRTFVAAVEALPA